MIQMRLIHRMTFPPPQLRISPLNSMNAPTDIKLYMEDVGRRARRSWHRSAGRLLSVHGECSCGRRRPAGNFGDAFQHVRNLLRNFLDWYRVGQAMVVALEGLLRNAKALVVQPE